MKYNYEESDLNKMSSMLLSNEGVVLTSVVSLLPLTYPYPNGSHAQDIAFVNVGFAYTGWKLPSAILQTYNDKHRIMPLILPL